ncbi:MAG TPA: HTTM domain-containing protein [Oculatellaceae cyanobacterium]
MNIWSKPIALWNEFFFAPKSVLPVAIYRIFLGGLALQTALFLLPDAATWFGPHAILSLKTILNHFGYPVFSLLYFLPDKEWSVQAVFVLLIASSVFVILGYRTRLSTVLTLLCLLTLYHRNPYLLHSGDSYLRQQFFWLIWSPAGKTLSLDRKLKKDAPNNLCPIEEPWAMRMMQLQFCLVYAHSCYSKIQDKSWFDGSAVYYSLHLTEFQKLTIPGMFDNIFLCKLLTWAALGLEFALFTLIWIKPIRGLVLLLGLLFHLTIDCFMNIPLFEWMMILSMVLFIDPQLLHRIDQKLCKFRRKEKTQLLKGPT